MSLCSLFEVTFRLFQCLCVCVEFVFFRHTVCVRTIFFRCILFVSTNYFWYFAAGIARKQGALRHMASPSWRDAVFRSLQLWFPEFLLSYGSMVLNTVSGFGISVFYLKMSKTSNLHNVNRCYHGHVLVYCILFSTIKTVECEVNCKMYQIMIGPCHCSDFVVTVSE